MVPFPFFFLKKLYGFGSKIVLTYLCSVFIIKQEALAKVMSNKKFTL